MKRRAIQAALVAFALWPLLHRGLVAAYDVDPWKFFGWAMYAAPVFQVDVILFDVHDGKGTKIPQEELSPRLIQAVNHFRLYRQTLGKLTSIPEEVGRVLLEERPQQDSVLVVVQTRSLNREARVETHVEQYVYQRPRAP